MMDFHQIKTPIRPRLLLLVWSFGVSCMPSFGEQAPGTHGVTNPTTPLVEPGETIKRAILTSSADAGPISTPASTPDLIDLPTNSDDLPLPTEVIPVNTNPGEGEGVEAGKPAGEATQPVSPLLNESPDVAPPIPPILSTGKRVQFSLDVEGVYDDNIFFSSKDPTSDYIFVASPKLTLQTGDFRAREESFATLNYNPQAIFFAKGEDENTLDQNLRVEIQYAIARLAINFQANYQHLSGATPDLGDRVDRDQTSARLKLSYGWGPKLEAETNFLYTGTNYDPEGLADFSEFVNETFLSYQMSARTKASFGVGVGRLEVDGFGHQTFERLLVQVISEVGARLTLKAKGGVEYRQTDLGDETTPIFALSMDYKLRESTTLALEAYRDVSASGGSPGENLTRTGIAAKVRQRLTKKLTGIISAGYEQLSYTAAESDLGGREDHYYFVRPSIQYELKEGRRFEVYYLHRTNDSDQSENSFEGNQVGASVGIDF